MPEAKKKELPPISTRRYQSNETGWAKFTADAQAHHLVGYDLVGLTGLGSQYFGAVWKLTRFRSPRQEANIVDEDELAEEGMLFLPR